MTIPHLTSTLSYFSHALIGAEPRYDFGFRQQDTKRSWRRIVGEPAEWKLQIGVGYFIVERAIRLGLMDEIVKKTLKDIYVRHRRINSPIGDHSGNILSMMKVEKSSFKVAIIRLLFTASRARPSFQSHRPRLTPPSPSSHELFLSDLACYQKDHRRR